MVHFVQFLAVFSIFTVCSIYAAPVKNEKENLVPVKGVEFVYDENLKVLIEEAFDWAHNVGLITRHPDHRTTSALSVTPGFTLFPSPFPRAQYEQALNVQQAMQLLRFRIANDFDFMMKAMKEVMSTDKETKRQVEMMEKVHKEGIKQPLTLMIFRSDYFVNAVQQGEGKEPKLELKQIEINIGPVGGPDRAARVSQVHRRMLEKAGMDTSERVKPIDRSDAVIAEGLYNAWIQFGDPNAFLLTLSYAPKNLPNFSTRFIQYEIERLSAGKHKIKFVRLSPHQCLGRLSLADDFSLLLDGKKVSVVYERVALTEAYPTKETWDLRLMIERSTAIKAASVPVQLAAAKKIQQILTAPGEVERFLNGPNETQMAQAVRETFAGLWGMDNEDEATMARIQDALDHPENYVMKPEGGGGGNNFFDEAVAEKLREFTQEQRAAHILMERLRPMVVKNYQIRPFDEPVVYGNMNSELGVFGYLLGNVKTGEVLFNKEAGAYLRTKPDSVNESGVKQGGVLDSAYLY